MSDTARIIGAFIRRDWLTRRTYRFAFAFDAFGFLSEVLFFVLMARLVDRGNLDQDLGTASYLAFVLVGISLNAIALPGLYAFTASLREEQLNGSLEVMLATPTPPVLVLLSAGVSRIGRGAISAAIYLGLGLAIAADDFHTSLVGVLSAALALLATTIVFSAAGAIAATVTLVFKRGGSSVAGVVSTALGLLAGTYVPLSIYPDWLRMIAKLVPLAWGLEAARSGLLRDRVATPELVALTGLALLSVPVAGASLRWGLGRSRRDGSLGQF